MFSNSGNNVVKPVKADWRMLLVTVVVMFVVVLCLNNQRVNQQSSSDSSTHEESEFLSDLIGERGTLAIFRRDGDEFRQSEILRTDFDSFVVDSIPVSTFQADHWASKYLANASGVLILVRVGSANGPFVYSMESWPIIDDKICFGRVREPTDIESLRGFVSRKQPIHEQGGKR